MVILVQYGEDKKELKEKDRREGKRVMLRVALKYYTPLYQDGGGIHLNIKIIISRKLSQDFTVHVTKLW